MDATHRVLTEVLEERHAQDVKWGEQNHPDGTSPRLVLPPQIRAAHARDVARRRCDNLHRSGHGTWESILTEEWTEVVAEHDTSRLRAELLQLAAVAVAWVEAIDRRTT